MKLNTNDIVVASYPKAGVSYLGWLLTAARAHANKLPIRPTFYNIDWLLIDDAQMGDRPRPVIWQDGMGDFIKTHANADAVPQAKNVIYLLRNPYDTLKSYYHFLRQCGNAKALTMTPRQFVDSSFGINAWAQHVNSWIWGGGLSRSTYVVQYEKVVENPGRELTVLFNILGTPLQEDDIEEALNCAGLPEMRWSEQHFAVHNPNYAKHNLEFVRPKDAREVDGFDPLRPYIESATSKAYEAVRSKLP